MSDRVFFSLAGAAAVLLVTVSLVWPQGIGARSPRPFGHATYAEQQAAAARAGKARAPVDAAHARMKGAF